MAKKLTGTLGANAMATATLPWDNWVDPTVVAAPINSTKVEVRDNVLTLIANDVPIGGLGESGLKALGIQAGWPTDFLVKLPLDIQTGVINARLDECDPRNLQFISEDNELKSVSTEWRSVVGHKTIAQAAYDNTVEAFGSDIEIKEAKLNGHLGITLMTPRHDEITPKEGDVLRYGLEIKHQYGVELGVNLYADRLWCANGAYAPHEIMSWRSKAHTDEAAQLNWLAEAVRNAGQAMTNLSERSRRMAETRFEGDPRTVLMERARAMGIPRSQFNDVWTAFEEEPGDTEWALANALTRFATHNENVNGRNRRRYQAAAGNWAQNFDIVDARLPRSVATKVGAQIIEHEGVVAN